MLRWLVVVWNRVRRMAVGLRPLPPPLSVHPPPVSEPPPVFPLPPPPAVVSVLVPARVEPETKAARRRRLDREERELLKRRLAHDVFVTPKGEPPPPAEPRFEPAADPVLDEEKKKAVVVEEGDEEVRSGELRVADNYHTTGEKVLYKEHEMYGEFNFRDTILEQLDLYWGYLRRMKARDPDTYGFYKQIGISLVPYISLMMNYDEIRKDYSGKLDQEAIDDFKRSIHISGWFHQQRPTFGAIARGGCTLPGDAEMRAVDLSRNKRGSLFLPVFMYFNKYKRPPADLQPMPPGDVYCVTMWWDSPVRKVKVLAKGGTPEEYGVWISKDGKQIRLLKCKQAWGTWVYPNEMKAWARRRGIDVQAFFCSHFCDLLRDWEVSLYSSVRVAVTHGDLVASFGVATERIPYFFQDRDYEQFDASGKRRRIFHAVKAHVRRDGTAVPVHFRGLREFSWAGYQVLITVPGLHHVDFLRDFNVGLYDENSMSPRERRKVKFIRAPAMAHKFTGYVQRGFGGWRR